MNIPRNRQDTSKLSFHQIGNLPGSPKKAPGDPCPAAICEAFTPPLDPSTTTIDDAVAAIRALTTPAAPGAKNAPTATPSPADLAKGKTLGISPREVALCARMNITPEVYAAKRAQIEARSPRSVRKGGAK